MRRPLVLLLLAAAIAAPSSCSKERLAHADCRSPDDDCRPAVTASQLDGTPLAEDNLAGKVVLVNFWATWCGPCVKEIPALEAVYQRHKAEGFVVVGLLAADGSTDGDAMGFLRAHSATYPVLRSTPELERKFGLRAVLPSSYVYDRAGRLKGRWEGGISEPELESQVKELLAP